MNGNVKSVDQSVNAIENTKLVFRQIDNLTQALSKSIQDVTLSLSGIEHNRETVEDIITSVAKVSQEFSDSSEEVAASTQEQVAVTEEIIDASSKLAKLSTELTQAIAQFKIN